MVSVWGLPAGLIPLKAAAVMGRPSDEGTEAYQQPRVASGGDGLPTSPKMRLQPVESCATPGQTSSLKHLAGLHLYPDPQKRSRCLSSELLSSG